MDTASVLAQIDSLLARARLVPGQFVDYKAFNAFPDGERLALITSWAAAIDRLSPPDSMYRRLVNETLNRYSDKGAAENAASILGILNTLRSDYEAGLLTSVAELIRADVFGDFLEMADELVGKGYKDAAAVITGSVLEEHLRKLADKFAVPVMTASGKHVKADTLNADLVKAKAYNKLEQKDVTAWLGLRNDAAHGHYDNYSHEQVVLMLGGIRGFMIRHAA